MKIKINTFLIIAVFLLNCTEKIPSYDWNTNGDIDLYENNNAPIDDRVEDAIARMTLEEKALLVVGTGFNTGVAVGVTKDKVPGAAGSTHKIASLGLPQIILADGPAGLRIQPTREGDDQTYYCTAFPIETLLASSWDVDLVNTIGKAMGNEVKEYGVDVLLAPALNIHRNPRAGRNFEYYSEDPVLAGKMTAAMVNGIESNGVGTSIKHFAANNQETNRMTVNTIVSERALREIYLRGFEIAVKEAQPWTVMSSYNRINDDYASQDHDLLEKVLRQDFGFQGVVMTDWFGGDYAPDQMYAGNDLIMPGDSMHTAHIIEAVKSGELAEADLNRNVRRILATVFQSPAFTQYGYSNKPNLQAHAKVARDAAAEGIILLKNEDAALPTKKTTKTVAAFGITSYGFIAGGTGSGDVNEAYTISLTQGLESKGISVEADLNKIYATFITKAEAERVMPESAFFLPPPLPEMKVTKAQAQEAARQSDMAFYTLGRNSGEFADRELEGDFYLSNIEKDNIRIISEAFHAAGKKVVVILNIGNVIETESWKHYPDAILLAWQGGQEGGNSVADVLTGAVTPSGKLPTTFPVVYDDIPSGKNFPGVNLSEEMEYILGGRFPKGKPSEVIYEEGIYVGYRYFDTFGVPVSYEFGFGLSYTSFGYDLQSAPSTFDDHFSVQVNVTNTGDFPGKEVVQLYVSAPDGAVDKPTKELKAFDKTGLLKPGESEVLTFSITPKLLASYVTSQNAWVADAGTYKVQIGASVNDIKATFEFTLDAPLVVEKTTKALAPSRVINELTSN